MDRDTAGAAEQTGTVLVVDDDANWCFISQRVLQKAGFGNQVITAGNGLEALERLRAMAAAGERLPELILLDIRMPVMDGFGFLEELSKAADLDLSRTRVYMCTSSSLPHEKERASRHAVAGFITKPLTQELLRGIL